MNFWVAIIGAIGLGSIVSNGLSIWIVPRASVLERRFVERKEAYLGLLDSWRQQDIVGYDDVEALHNVGHWVLRVELVASKKVFMALQDWKSSEPGSDVRILATEALKAAMRKDLG